MKKIISILLFTFILFANSSIAWAKSALLYYDTVVLDSSSEYSREEVLSVVVKSAEEKKPTITYTEQKGQGEQKANGVTLKDLFKSF